MIKTGELNSIQTHPTGTSETCSKIRGVEPAASFPCHCASVSSDLSMVLKQQALQ